MSDTILPFQEWPEGIAQASVPANENSLRNEALRRPCLGISNNVASPADGDLYIVGDTPTGNFSTFNENDLAFARVTDDGTSWYAWAPTNGLRIWMDDGSQKVYVGESTNEWQDVASGGAAADVSYDNATSGLTATDVQAAIDELASAGVPPGGTTGQVLAKVDGTDFNTEWVDQTGGGGAVSSVNGDTGAVIVPVPVVIACSDETTALTTGTAKATFRMPFAMTLTAVRASLTTAQSSGSIFTVDINEGGSSILSTKLTIDNTEKTSTTAATAPVISDSALADDAEITIDIDQVGASGATGLKVYLIGYPA